eukprot:CAMPEP_0195519306 /NCGR_PEP_ID=MMETSP0794_2-20130614/14565_1 /TAXON_ID=515487 /ORGANISM="Stephanopyxis turris, Strain CCMP 815" /LENGTH=1033 /DNA_ID=CAMNT_0040648431 /DNA_START=85 /DNA_END=3186 /DNA_ORIENTATION=+
MAPRLSDETEMNTYDMDTDDGIYDDDQQYTQQEDSDEEWSLVEEDEFPGENGRLVSDSHSDHDPFIDEDDEDYDENTGKIIVEKEDNMIHGYESTIGHENDDKFALRQPGQTKPIYYRPKDAIQNNPGLNIMDEEPLRNGGEIDEPYVLPSDDDASVGLSSLTMSLVEKPLSRSGTKFLNEQQDNSTPSSSATDQITNKREGVKDENNNPKKMNLLTKFASRRGLICWSCSLVVVMALVVCCSNASRHHRGTATLEHGSSQDFEETVTSFTYEHEEMDDLLEATTIREEEGLNQDIDPFAAQEQQANDSPLLVNDELETLQETASNSGVEFFIDNADDLLPRHSNITTTDGDERASNSSLHIFLEDIPQNEEEEEEGTQDSSTKPHTIMVDNCWIQFNVSFQLGECPSSYLSKVYEWGQDAFSVKRKNYANSTESYSRAVDDVHRQSDIYFSGGNSTFITAGDEQIHSNPVLLTASIGGLFGELFFSNAMEEVRNAINLIANASLKDALQDDDNDEHLAKNDTLDWFVGAIMNYTGQVTNFSTTATMFHDTIWQKFGNFSKWIKEDEHRTHEATSAQGKQKYTDYVFDNDDDLEGAFAQLLNSTVDTMLQGLGNFTKWFQDAGAATAKTTSSEEEMKNRASTNNGDSTSNGEGNSSSNYWWEEFLSNSTQQVTELAKVIAEDTSEAAKSIGDAVSFAASNMVTWKDTTESFIGHTVHVVKKILEDIHDRQPPVADVVDDDANKGGKDDSIYNNLDRFSEFVAETAKEALDLTFMVTENVATTAQELLTETSNMARSVADILADTKVDVIYQEAAKQNANIMNEQDDDILSQEVKDALKMARETFKFADGFNKDNNIYENLDAAQIAFESVRSSMAGNVHSSSQKTKKGKDFKMTAEEANSNIDSLSQGMEDAVKFAKATLLNFADGINRDKFHESFNAARGNFESVRSSMKGNVQSSSQKTTKQTDEKRTEETNGNMDSLSQGMEDVVTFAKTTLSNFADGINRDKVHESFNDVRDNYFQSVRSFTENAKKTV